MPQSLSRVMLHIIFSTKDRQVWITDALAPDLHAYLAGTLKGLNCSSMQVGGAKDHIHALVALCRTKAIADLIHDVKLAGNQWMKERGLQAFAWQAGYGVFSVSESRISKVRAYIRDQPEHHRRRSFQEEYRGFLKRHHIDFDERYVWD